MRLIDLFQLRNALPQGESTLSHVFGMARDAAVTRESLLAQLSEDTGWDLGEVQFLVGDRALDFEFPDAYRDERALGRLEDCFALMKRLGVTARQCRSWAKQDIGNREARGIKQAVKARYPDDQWLEIGGPVRNALREKQRAALVSYLIAHPNPAKGWKWEDSNGLYEYFLIDVEMSPCQMTSRIKQAISSVQMFVQRCLLNLETEVQANSNVDEDWLYWDWMKSYRVWEANRKVFLYPENWIEPELRDDKSPFFEDLENELLQNDVTTDMVETAFVGYLEKLQDVARLEICGMFQQTETSQPNGKGEVLVDVLHAFGRTRGTPHRYYYRRRIDSAYWTAWQLVDMDIEGDHLIPVIWNRRLYLLWPIFSELSDRKPVKMPDTDETIDEPPKYLKVEMAWTEYRNGKWSAKKISTKSLTNWDLWPDVLLPIKDAETKSMKREREKSDARIHKANDELRTDKTSFVFKGLVEPETGELIVRCYAGTLGSGPGFGSSGAMGHEAYKRIMPLGEFRFTGCDGNVHVSRSEASKYSNTLPPPGTDVDLPLIPPRGTHVENMMFVEGEETGGDDEQDLIVTELHSNSWDNKIVPVLQRTPGVFSLLVPHQYETDDPTISLTPFYYQDRTRTFVVSPEDVTLYLPLPDKTQPGSLDLPPTYYSSQDEVPNPEGPVTRGDPIIFEPSFLFGSQPATASASNMLSAPGAQTRSVAVALARDTALSTSPQSRSMSSNGGDAPTFGTISDVLASVDSTAAKGQWAPMAPKRFYRFETFYHPFVCTFIRELNRDGLDGLLQRSIQLQPQWFDNSDHLLNFDATYEPEPVVERPYPIEDVDFSYGGAYASYNWELVLSRPAADRRRG